MASYLQYRPATIGNQYDIPSTTICRLLCPDMASYLQYRPATLAT
jgi:hypothetical protein